MASTYMNEHTHGACGKAAGTPGSVLQMRKPRFRVAKGLAQDHTVRKCQREGWDLAPRVERGPKAKTEGGGRNPRPLAGSPWCPPGTAELLESGTFPLLTRTLPQSPDKGYGEEIQTKGS